MAFVLYTIGVLEYLHWLGGWSGLVLMHSWAGSSLRRRDRLMLNALRPLKNLYRMSMCVSLWGSRLRLMRLLELLRGLLVPGKTRWELFIARGIRNGLLGLRYWLGGLIPHCCLDFFQTHDLPTRSRPRHRLLCRSTKASAQIRLCKRLRGAHSPNSTIDVEVRHGLWFIVLFIAGSYWFVWLLCLLRLIVRLLLLLDWGGSGSRLSAMKTNMLFGDSIGYLGRLSKEVKVFAYFGCASVNRISSKSIIVESVIGVIELVAKAIIRILKVESIVAVSVSVSVALALVVAVSGPR